MANDLIPIQNFNLGGLADSKFSGTKNSFYKLTGFDMHSQPGLLKVAQKLTAETGTVPSELCRVAVNSSNGAQYWFSYTSGKIWERPTTGTWRLVHTTTPAAGTAGCLGAAEYQGYIYWATQSRLHRITVAHADDNNWAANAVEDWATFSITDTAFHPMINHTAQQILYIGDGNYLAQVDAGVFTADALDIATPLRIKSLGEIGTDVLLGTYVASTITQTEIIRWNGWSVSFTSSDKIPEVGINAFLPADNYVFVQAGLAGNIYVYNGTALELYRKIPGDYSPTKYGSVYPDSVANYHGEILFGFSNGSGNPTDQGVYRIARSSRNYPYILDFPYPISQRSGDDLVITGVEMGAILVVGNDLFAAWKNGTSYGVDKLDWTTKLSGAYLETRVATTNREQFFNVSKFVVAYETMPENCSVAIQYSRNHDDYADTTEVKDTDRKIILSESEGLEANTIQTKWTMTTSGNNAPTIESGGIFLR